MDYNGCKNLFRKNVELFGVLIMISIKWKKTVYIILSLIAGVWVITWFCSGMTFSFSYVCNCIGYSATFLLIVSGIFCSYLWKLKVFQNWLVTVPNLNGVWKGTIVTNWSGSNCREKQPTIEVTLTIKQSLFRISCVLETSESFSRSIHAGFRINPDDQIKQLCYSYQNTPQPLFREKSPIHFGAIILNINENNGKLQLEGEYWTSRKTGGCIALVLDQKK